MLKRLKSVSMLLFLMGASTGAAYNKVVHVQELSRMLRVKLSLVHL